MARNELIKIKIKTGALARGIHALRLLRRRYESVFVRESRRVSVRLRSESETKGKKLVAVAVSRHYRSAQLSFTQHF